MTLRTYSDALVTFDGADLFFTSDGGKLGEAGASEERPRRTSIGGTSRAPFIVAPIVSRLDAVFLQESAPVANEITTSGVAHIVSHVRLHAVSPAGDEQVSQWLTAPIDLCAGCLTAVPACIEDRGTADPADDVAVDPVPNDALCSGGADVPSFVCPD
jgi:hypothetical protein